jgi:hypothetical protein
MRDENGIEMTEDQILEEACELLSGVCELLYETTEETSHAAAYMADACLKYLQVIRLGCNVLSAAADYQAFEEDVYQAKLAARDEQSGMN